jgi:hypothetical protein
LTRVLNAEIRQTLYFPLRFIPERGCREKGTVYRRLARVLIFKFGSGLLKLTDTDDTLVCGSRGESSHPE